jgi:hypothetical protein
MAIFVAAGDESDGPQQRGPFLYGGFVAPLADWDDWFAPAWRERVLAGRRGHPAIPFLHMADIRSPKWRAAHGLTFDEAESRVDEACRVIGSSGALRFCYGGLDGGHFRDTFKTTKLIRPGKQPGTYAMEPDYMGFLGFAYAALEYVHDHHPDAQLVNFVVERKTGVTHHIPDFVRSIGDGLRRKGQGHLVRLVGELVPAGKEHFGLQAADVALWHSRRKETGLCESCDHRRWVEIFNLRQVVSNGLTPAQVEQIDKRSKGRRIKSPFKKKTTQSRVPPVRSPRD